MLNVAIVGIGWFGTFHLKTCLNINDVRVKAVVSTNPEKLIWIKQSYPEIKTYQNYIQLLSEEKNLDALIITVPPNKHEEIEIEAAKRRINLFIEKPLGINKDRVFKNLEEIEKSKIITSIGYHSRYNPALEELKKALKEETIGTVSAKWIDTIPLVHWWRDKNKSGGQIVEQATHLIDCLRYLVGDIDEVMAFSRSGLNKNIPDFATDSASVTILKFKNGIIGTLETGCYKTPEAEKSVSITIDTINKKGSYFWNSYAEWDGEKLEAPTSNDIYKRELETFFEAIKTKNASLIKCNYKEGVKTFLATMAIEEALAKKIPIKVECI